MAWFAEGEPHSNEAADENALALERVGTSAQLSLYNVVRRAFEQEMRSGLTRKELAGRLGSSRTLVSRLLAKPSNMTIETAARLMFCMGRELKISERQEPASPTTWSGPNSGTLNLINSTVRVFTHDGHVMADARFHQYGDVTTLQLVCGNEDLSGLYEQLDRATPGMTGSPSQFIATRNAGSPTPIALKTKTAIDHA